ncbi:hypothetical protein CTAYLR_000590 [Chrysophaeum taylorii]|uniref:Uncharacterized protein n=1 Tax=Chrysophaeum taylorii TaxID=2483200 RepID=A0AAD7XR02_9STRA|nr:hypothetical protein CTAYLR_000590 [Chrysophaeum taylorii]
MIRTMVLFVFFVVGRRPARILEAFGRRVDAQIVALSQALMIGFSTPAALFLCPRSQTNDAGAMFEAAALTVVGFLMWETEHAPDHPNLTWGVSVLAACLAARINILPSTLGFAALAIATGTTAVWVFLRPAKWLRHYRFRYKDRVHRRLARLVGASFLSLCAPALVALNPETTSRDLMRASLGVPAPLVFGLLVFPF